MVMIGTECPSLPIETESITDDLVAWAPGYWWRPLLAMIARCFVGSCGCGIVIKTQSAM
jgi:hypothetical protein